MLEFFNHMGRQTSLNDLVIDKTVYPPINCFFGTDGKLWGDWQVMG